MDDLTLDALSHRLDNLQRENRRWRFFAVGLAMTAIGLVLFFNAGTLKSSDVVRAKKVIIIDSQGNPRIEFGKANDVERFGVTLLRPKGEVAAELFAEESVGVLFTGVVLNGINGESRIQLGTSSGSTFDRSSLRLAGNNDVIPNTAGLQRSPESIEMEVRSSRNTDDPKYKIEPSTASLTLRTNLIGASFWLDAHTAQLDFQNFEAPPPAAVLANNKGSLELGLIEGKPTVTLSENVVGMPGLVLGHTKLEKRATGAVEERSAPSVVMFNKDGNVIWRAP